MASRVKAGGNPHDGKVAAALDALQEALENERSRLAEAMKRAVERADPRQRRKLGAEADALDALQARSLELGELWRQLEAARSGVGNEMPSLPFEEGDLPLPTQPHRRAHESRTIGLDRVLQSGYPELHVRGAKPVELRLPDEEPIPLRHWNEVAEHVVIWLAKRHTIPIPFRGRSRGAHYFVAADPIHGDGTPFNEGGRREVGDPSHRFWLDTNRNASDLLRSVALLARECGASTRAIRVTYATRARGS